MKNTEHTIFDGRREFCVRSLGYLIGASTVGLTSAAENKQAQIARRESIDFIAADKLAKIEAAISEMMARSKKDPRDPKGWLANSDPHREFCAAPGIGGINQIHFCYWFLPWHRAYLTVMDRKIREISGDGSLSFPYWNWSSNLRLPARFTANGSALSNAIRFTPDRPLDASEIDYFKDDPARKNLGVAALGASKFVSAPMTDRVALAKELQSSFGGLVRPNNQSVYGNSRLEGTPHGPIHVYVGGRNEVTMAVGDMTDFATAARDPLFFAHHGNLDRLWEIWRSNPANRAKEPTTSDFLNHMFAFPWLDGTTMQISVAETLDTKLLGYSYDNLNVFDPAPPKPQFQPEAMQKKPLSPILDKTLSLPATPEAAAFGKPHYFLLLEGVASPKRALSAGIYVSAANDLNAAKILVGTLAVVRSGGEYRVVDDVLIFDISSAVDILKTSKLKVTVVPNEIGGERKSPYKPLRYRSARIVIQ